MASSTAPTPKPVAYGTLDAFMKKGMHPELLGSKVTHRMPATRFLRRDPPKSSAPRDGGRKLRESGGLRRVKAALPQRCAIRRLRKTAREKCSSTNSQRPNPQRTGHFAGESTPGWQTTIAPSWLAAHIANEPCWAVHTKFEHVDDPTCQYGVRIRKKIHTRCLLRRVNAKTKPCDIHSLTAPERRRSKARLLQRGSNGTSAQTTTGIRRRVVARTAAEHPDGQIALPDVPVVDTHPDVPVVEAPRLGLRGQVQMRPEWLPAGWDARWHPTCKDCHGRPRKEFVEQAGNRRIFLNKAQVLATVIP